MKILFSHLSLLKDYGRATCQVRKKSPGLVENNFLVFFRELGVATIKPQTVPIVSLQRFYWKESPSICVNKQIINFTKIHGQYLNALKKKYNGAFTELLYSWIFSKYSFITDNTSKSILTYCAFLTFMTLFCTDKLKESTWLGTYINKSMFAFVKVESLFSAK